MKLLDFLSSINETTWRHGTVPDLEAVSLLTEIVVYNKMNPDTRKRWSIHMNPTAGQVIQLFDRSAFQHLRGWLNSNGGNLFVWDAEEATHWDVVHELLKGQALPEGYPFEIETRPPGIGILVWAGEDELVEIDEALRSNPHFDRAFHGIEINGDPDLHEGSVGPISSSMETIHDTDGYSRKTPLADMEL